MRFLLSGLTLGLTVLSPVAAWAQESKSEGLAKELVSALDAAKLTSVAAIDPSNPGFYVGALYLPGAQILAVTAKFPAPAALDHKIGTKAYREVYLDLSAGAATEKIFVEDMGANGLSSKRKGNEAFDSVEVEGKRVALDNLARRQKLTSEQYQKIYTDADARYVQMLGALIAQLKKP